MANIGSLTADLRLESAAFIRDMGKAQRAVASNTAAMRKSMRQVEQAGRNVQRQFSQLRGAAVALAGALAVRQFTQFAKGAIDSAGALQDVAQKVGLSTKALQQLRFAAEQTGIAQTTLDMAMQRFSRRLGEVAQGQGELLKTAQQYNVAIRDSDGVMRSNVDILKDFADVIRRAESDQERLRIGFKLFDSEGAALANTLREGRVGLERYMQQAVEFGAVMSGPIIAQAKIASDNLAALHRVYNTAFDTAIIKGFAGSLMLTRDAIEQARQTGEQFGKAVGAAMRGVVTVAKFVADNMREIAAAIAALLAFKAAGMFLGIATAILTFGSALKTAAAAQGILNIAMAANPALKLAAAVAALGAAFLALRPAVEELDTLQKRLEVIDNRVKTLREREAMGLAGLVFGPSAQRKAEIAELEKEAAKIRARLDEMKKAAQAGAESLSTLGGSTDEASAKAAEYVKNLKIEVGQLRDLASMTKLSAAAGRDFALVIEQENAVKSAGIDLTKAHTKADRDASAEIRKLVAERKKLTAEIAQQNRIVEGKDRLVILRKEASLIGVTTRERTIAVAVLEKELELKQLGVDLTSEAARQEIQLTKQIAETSAELEKAKENRELFLEPFKNAIRGIQDSFTDAFENIFSGGVDSFSDLASTVKRIFIRLAAEIASLMVFRPAVAGVLGSVGLGGIAQQMGLSGGVGIGGGPMLSGGGGGGFSLSALGSMPSFLPQFLQTGIFDAVTAIGGNTIGAANFAVDLVGAFNPGNALAGFAGGLAANMLGLGGGVGGSIGGTLGGIGGAIVGGPIGAAVGSFLGTALGGLFGGDQSFPFAKAQLGTSGGQIVVANASSLDGGDATAIRNLAQTIADATNTIAQTVSATIRPGSVAGAEVISSSGHFAPAGLLGLGAPFDPSQGERFAVEYVRTLLSNPNVASGISGVVATALANSRATTLEQLGSDIEFAQSLSGMTTQVSAFDQAMQQVAASFAEATARAQALGISTEQLAAAQAREEEAVRMQFRAPFIAAAEQIAGFLRTTQAQFASPADQIRMAQAQFGDLIGRVRGGEVGLTQPLLQTAQALIGVSRSHFASTVDFQGMDRMVRSQLASVGETLTSDAFFDAQVEATRQQTEVLSGGSSLANIEAAIDALREEFRREIRQLAAA